MRLNRTLMPFALVLTVLLVQCSSDDPSGPGGDGGGQTVVFTLTPSPLLTTGMAMPPYQITERYAFHCVDNTEPECPTSVYEDVPDDEGDWMSFPRTSLTCIPFFAEITMGDAHLSLTGTLIRRVGEGAGPLATGNYQRFEGTNFEVGTFSLDSQALSGGGDNVCP